MNENEILEFVTPYYENKDIMHNLWHIELVKKWVDHILMLSHYNIDKKVLMLAMYFHGFIYSDENAIRQWMMEKGFAESEIEQVVKIAWESQRNEEPETLEGKILHDAHVLEGGKTYLVVKTLITGSVRGQDLLTTLEYMKNHVLGENKCYLPETAPLCEEMNAFAEMFYQELRAGID